MSWLQHVSVRTEPSSGNTSFFIKQVPLGVDQQQFSQCACRCLLLSCRQMKNCQWGLKPNMLESINVF